jgi:hypothetical protein
MGPVFLASFVALWILVVLLSFLVLVLYRELGEMSSGRKEGRTRDGVCLGSRAPEVSGPGQEQATNTKKRTFGIARSDGPSVEPDGLRENIGELKKRVVAQLCCRGESSDRSFRDDAGGSGRGAPCIDRRGNEGRSAYRHTTTRPIWCARAHAE